jgi:regulator of sigma D
MTKLEYFFEETGKHIRNVQFVMNDMVKELLNRIRCHDCSKYDEIEKESFAEIAPELSKVLYNSDEYKENLKKIKPALEHHQRVNPHHPEHYVRYVCNGCFTIYKSIPDRCNQCGYSQFQKEADVSGMNLIDLMEMLADWLAATTMSPNGDIMISIEKNQQRFKYSDELKSILKNTARKYIYDLGMMEEHFKYVE